MIKFTYKDLIIEVFDDPLYKHGSTENASDYTKHYFGRDGEKAPTSKHGIRILSNEVEINNCVVIGSGGRTRIFETSALIDNQQLLICCCNTVFCVSLPGLELIWKTEADSATCFQIQKLGSDYIVHGEMLITRLDPGGEVKWEFGGEDIFVSMDNETFWVRPDHIELMDFNNKRYKIGFDGKTMEL